MRRRAFTTLLAATLLVGTTSAQSFNIDFDFLGAGQNNGAPAVTYGAALLQPGTWNEVQFDMNGIVQVLPNPMNFALIEVGGTQTGVTVTLTAPAPLPGPLGSTAYFPGTPPPAPPACTGWGNQDIALYDGVVFPDPPDGVQTLYDLTFTGLLPGVYILFTYAKCEEPEVGGPSALPFTIVNPLIPGVPARVILNRCPGFPAIHATPHTFVGHVLTVPASGLLTVQLSTLDAFWQQFCLSAMQLRFLGAVGSVGASYCATNPNSTGISASIGAVATTVPSTNPPSASAGANDLVLTGTGLVPNQSCIFLYGRSQLIPWTPLQDGFLCVGPPITRMQPPKASVDGSGATFIPVDNSVYPGLTPGSTLYFQLWYSDPGGVTGENLSDAIQISFGP